MKKLALLLSLLAVGALGPLACGGGDDETTAATESETTPDRLSCGGIQVNGPYPLMKLTVVEGDVSCHVARRVMGDLYDGRGRLIDAEHAPAPFVLVQGSWRCGGTDGPEECKKAQRRPSVKTIRTHAPINKGGQGADTTEAELSAKQQIERIANKWAPLYAAAPNPDACSGWDELHPNREIAAKYMAQPPCERAVCIRVPNLPIKNCTPPSPGFQKSFAAARVEDIEIKGDRAAARFSNGEGVRLIERSGAPCMGSGCTEGDEVLDPAWWIVKIGGKAGREFFD